MNQAAGSRKWHTKRSELSRLVQACLLIYEGDMFAQAGSSTEFAEFPGHLVYRVRWVRMSQRSSDHSANVVAQVGSNELTSQPHEATPSKERTVALSMPR